MTKKIILIASLLLVIISVLVLHNTVHEWDKNMIETHIVLAQKGVKDGIHPFRIDKDLYMFVLPSKWKSKPMYIGYTNDDNKIVEVTDSPINIRCDSINVMELGNVGRRLWRNKIRFVVLETSIMSMFLSTESGNMEYLNEDKSHKEKGAISLIKSDGQFLYHGKLEEIKGRGCFSWLFDDKKPYNIQLADKIKIGNLNKDNEFCLIGCHSDSAFIRNSIAMQCAMETGMPYAVRYDYVQVYFNGEYNGLYQITNKVKISSSSVNITNISKETRKLNGKKYKKKNVKTYAGVSKDIISIRGISDLVNPKDITGGYIIETQSDEKCGFELDGGISSSLKSPTNATVEQVDYISKKYKEMMDAVYSAKGINMITGKHYSEYIDVESFVKYYLLQELFFNRDGGTRSVFMFKDKDSIDSLFYAGPIWDFVSATGAANLESFAHIPNVFFVKETKYGNGSPTLLSKLASNSQFHENVKQVYANIVRKVVEENTFGNKYKKRCSFIKKEILLNNFKWCRRNTSSEIEHQFAYLSSFMESRIAFFDKVFLSGQDLNKIEIHMNKPNVTFLYYLSDGETPNLPKELGYKEKPIGWYFVGTNIKYDDGVKLNDGDKLELRWRRLTTRELIEFYWNNKEKLTKYL